MAAFQPASQDALGMPPLVTFRRIEKTDPRIQCRVHRRDRHVIILLTPEGAAGERPASQREHRHIDIRLPELSVFYQNSFA